MSGFLSKLGNMRASLIQEEDFFFLVEVVARRNLMEFCCLPFEKRSPEPLSKM